MSQPLPTSSEVRFTPDHPGVYRLDFWMDNGTASSEVLVAEVRVIGDLDVPLDYATVGEGLASLAPGSTLTVGPGVWPLVADRGTLDTTIVGAGRDQTILDGQALGTVFRAKDATLALSDLTITGGFGGEGGGLSFTNAEVTLTNVAILANVGTQGGGLFCETCNATIIGSLIADNVSGFQGGGILFQGSTLDKGQLDMVQSALLANIAPDDWGGGLFMKTGSDGNLTNVIVSDNAAVNGGGISVNSASSSLWLEHVTATFNAADDQGAFLRFSPGVDLTIVDSIIWGNDNVAAIWTDSLDTFSQTYCLVGDNAGDYEMGNQPEPIHGVDGNQINVGDPAWLNTSDDLDWTNDTWRLDPATSTAVDAGDPAGTLDPDGSAPDLGAFGGALGAWTP